MARRRTRNPVRVKVRGLPAFQRQMAGLPAEIKLACFRALQQSGEAIVDDVRAGVRKDTRTLAEGVGARYENNRLRAQVGWWKPEHAYAKYPELGTRRRPAQPSLLPAAVAERRRFPDRIAAEINRVIR
ncbi:HK97 gp10 family phage protein [Streptomyces sp. NPDC057235]|uniref:HK97 gp10 family phage protein n=1 Tax=Streptomyces sp. NPDC057235 TaxID=3346058 RepID=UPI003629E7F5